MIFIQILMHVLVWMMLQSILKHAKAAFTFVSQYGIQRIFDDVRYLGIQMSLGFWREAHTKLTQGCESSSLMRIYTQEDEETKKQLQKELAEKSAALASKEAQDEAHTAWIETLEKENKSLLLRNKKLSHTINSSPAYPLFLPTYAFRRPKPAPAPQTSAPAPPAPQTSAAEESALEHRIRTLQDQLCEAEKKAAADASEIARLNTIIQSLEKRARAAERNPAAEENKKLRQRLQTVQKQLEEAEKKEKDAADAISTLTSNGLLVESQRDAALARESAERELKDEYSRNGHMVLRELEAVRAQASGAMAQLSSALADLEKEKQAALKERKAAEEKEAKLKKSIDTYFDTVKALRAAAEKDEKTIAALKARVPGA